MVEDDPFFAAVVARGLQRAGHRVVGPSARLAGRTSWRDAPAWSAPGHQTGRVGELPVASLLQRRGIPFAFISATDSAELPPGVPQRRLPPEARHAASH